MTGSRSFTVNARWGGSETRPYRSMGAKVRRSGACTARRTTAHRTTARRTTAHRETAHRETAHREITHREIKHREMTHRTRLAYLSTTRTRSGAPRPNTSGWYISSAFGGGAMNVPGVVARAMYV